jgi:hypothetical protein
MASGPGFSPSSSSWPPPSPTSGTATWPASTAGSRISASSWTRWPTSCSLVATFVPFYLISNPPTPSGHFPYWGAFPAWVLAVIFGRELLVTVVRQVAARRGRVIPAGPEGKLKAVFQNIFCGATIFWYALQSAAVTYGWTGVFWDRWQAWLHAPVVLVSLAVAAGSDRLLHGGLSGQVAETGGGSGCERLVERVSERLADRGLRLTVAESCTGGLLAATLTDLPGASRFLWPAGHLLRWRQDPGAGCEARRPWPRTARSPSRWSGRWSRAPGRSVNRRPRWPSRVSRARAGDSGQAGRDRVGGGQRAGPHVEATFPIRGAARQSARPRSARRWSCSTACWRGHES